MADIERYYIEGIIPQGDGFWCMSKKAFVSDNNGVLTSYCLLF